MSKNPLGIGEITSLDGLGINDPKVLEFLALKFLKIAKKEDEAGRTVFLKEDKEARKASFALQDSTQVDLILQKDGSNKINQIQLKYLFLDQGKSATFPVKFNYEYNKEGELIGSFSAEKIDEVSRGKLIQVLSSIELQIHEGSHGLPLEFFAEDFAVAPFPQLEEVGVRRGVIPTKPFVIKREKRGEEVVCTMKFRDEACFLQLVSFDNLEVALAALKSLRISSQCTAGMQELSFSVTPIVNEEEQGFVLNLGHALLVKNFLDLMGLQEDQKTNSYLLPKTTEWFRVERGGQYLFFANNSFLNPDSKVGGYNFAPGAIEGSLQVIQIPSTHSRPGASVASPCGAAAADGAAAARDGRP